MKKSLFLAILITAIPNTALAQMRGYKGNDGYFHIRGLNKNQNYKVDLGGMPLIRAAVSNSCGILRISSGRAVKESDRLEIKDEKKAETYGFDNKNIPIRETNRCNGQPLQTREVWKDSKGTIYISGLTPSGSQTIRLLTASPTRNLKANLCGMISIKLDNNPKAVILEGRAFPTDGQASRAILCRRGTLYIGYPTPPEVISISAAEWKQQNSSPQFSSSTIVASFDNGGNVTWSEPPGGGETPGGETPTPGGEEPPPPPGGGGGTTPPDEPPPEEPPEEPKPPSNQKMCKVGEQLVAIGLKPNTKHYAATPEDDVYSEAISNSSGYIIFGNIDYNDYWEGESAEIEVGQIDNTKPAWANRKPLGGSYTMRLSVVQPCQ